MWCGQAELDVDQPGVCEGGHAGSLSHIPSLTPFWQDCGRRVLEASV
jgi:hypothetical protein